MSRQSNKIQLVSDIKTEHRRLEKCLSQLTKEDMLLPNVAGDWSVKDILAHLTAWERLLSRWYQAGLQNETATPSPVGMSRLAIDQLNRRIHADHQQDLLEKVQDEFQASYQRILRTIEATPEADMFTKGRFPWTGRWTLADYIAGNTCNHYAWAKAKIMRWMKEHRSRKNPYRGEPIFPDRIEE